MHCGHMIWFPGFVAHLCLTVLRSRSHFSLNCVASSPRRSLLSQIVRLANEFDALTRGRRSKRPLTVLDALENMRSHRGTTYQRALFDVFEQLVGGVTEEEQQEAHVLPLDAWFGRPRRAARGRPGHPRHLRCTRRSRRAAPRPSRATTASAARATSGSSAAVFYAPC